MARPIIHESHVRKQLVQKDGVGSPGQRGALNSEVGSKGVEIGFRDGACSVCTGYQLYPCAHNSAPIEADRDKGRCTRGRSSERIEGGRERQRVLRRVPSSNKFPQPCSISVDRKSKPRHGKYSMVLSYRKTLPLGKYVSSLSLSFQYFDIRRWVSRWFGEQSLQAHKFLDFIGIDVPFLVLEN